MKKSLLQLSSFLLISLLCFAFSCQQGEEAQQLSAEDLAANQELDRRFVEAYNQKDVARLMGTFWNSPNLVVVLYDGTVYIGWEAVRQAVEQFFAGLESARVQIVEVTHLRSGDGVVAVGTATYQLQPKEGPPQQFTGRWSDFRRKVQGQWVYVHDHAQVLPTPNP